MPLSILFLGLTLQASAADRNLQISCSTIKHNRPGKVCLFETVGSQNSDVIYYFHGMGGNERAWTEAGKEIREAWTSKGYDAPRVIAFSFGYYWSLAEKNSSPTSGLLEEVADHLIPQVEQKLAIPVRNRFVLGHSMGGYNASLLLMKRSQLFDKAVLLCPGLFSISPHYTLREFVDYIFKTGAWAHLVWFALAHWKMDFPTPDDWTKSAPLLVAEKELGAHSPETLISCSDRDEFGLFRGSQSFVDIALKKNARVRWIPVYGTSHCVQMPNESAADFLVD